MFETAEWTYRGKYIVKRGLTPVRAERCWVTPIASSSTPTPPASPATASASFVIPRSPTRFSWGLNAWQANRRDLRIYDEQD